MSRETESALTPEEWKARGVDPLPFIDDSAHRVEVLEAGELAVTDDDGGVNFPDARKVMALANLSLTLEKKPGAITGEHVAICTSAAWYFRRMRSDAMREARAGADAEYKERCHGRAKAMEAADKVARELAAVLSALVPPQ